MKTIKFFYAACFALMASALLSSCEKEEEVALTMSGTWQTTDQLFTRTYHGQPLRTTKTVFYFLHEREHATVGDGYALEYYDSKEFPVTYHSILWETWTRQNGDVGIMVKYRETDDKFSTISYSLDDNNFSGKCNLNDGPDQDFRFVRGPQPDVSKIKYWGFNELMPTWHPMTYQGEIDIRREYQGTVYKPTSVVITFDVDPRYNNISVDYGFVRENYDNAPWGTYLADTIRYWQINKYWDSQNILIKYGMTSETEGEYTIMNAEFTEDTFKGEIFIDTNVFTPFTLHRTSDPDWSKITKWGIVKQTK